MLVAYEKIYPLAAMPESGARTFIRFDLAIKASPPNLKRLSAPGVIPILWQNRGEYHPIRSSFDHLACLIEEHISFAKELVHAGFKDVVLAADNDGALHRILSPRFSTLSLEERIRPMAEVFKSLKDIVPNVSIILPVEELCPGGLDATDGITIARALMKLGLKEIIATAGTKDFTPCHDRRMTHKKPGIVENFYSNEPNLASAAWLLDIADLPIYCLAYFDDPLRAQQIAKSLGLAGVIKKA